MINDCKPSWSAIWLQTAGSYPVVVSISLRTSVSGDLSSRNRRTDLRSSSCSLLQGQFTALPSAEWPPVQDHVPRLSTRTWTMLTTRRPPPDTLAARTVLFLPQLRGRISHAMTHPHDPGSIRGHRIA